MSLITPTPIEGFPSRNNPYTNVTPFTERDSWTFLRTLEELRKYIRETLILHVDKEIGELGELWDAEVIALIAAVNASLEAQAADVNLVLETQTAEVDQKIADMIALVNETVQQVLENSVEINDAMMQQLISDSASGTRAALDAQYAGIDIANTVTSGRLSADQLDDTYAGIDIADIVNSGRLSPAILSETFAGLSEFQETRTAFYDSYYDVRRWGAAGNGTTDDTAALQRAIDSEMPLYWGKRTYRITATLTRTITSDLFWRSDGSRIVLDRATSVSSAILIGTGGNNVHIDGGITLDCQQKSFTGWYFINATSTFGNFYASELGVRNCYRANDSIPGGDGIWVRGAWQNVYLERPDVRNVRMAIGAGVSGSQGICGITVSRDTVTPSNAPITVTINAPHVSGVVSEDINYMADQDGIRVFSDYGTESQLASKSSFSIIGGLIENIGGRAVKAQMESGSIIGTRLNQDGIAEPMVARNGTMPSIDFQVGGGIVRDVEANYINGSPRSFVLFSGTRQATARAVGGGSVTGVKCYVVNTRLTAFASLVMHQASVAKVEVSDIEVQDRSFSGHFVELSGPSGSAAIINVLNCFARLDSPNNVVYRTSALPAATACVTNFYRSGSSTVPAFGTSGGVTTGFTTMLAGLNRGITA